MMLDKIKSVLPLNFALLSNPVNWVVVFLMVAVAGAALALIFSKSHLNPSTPMNVEE